MFRQLSVTFALAGSAFLLSGCESGHKAAHEAPATTQGTAPTAAMQGITLHVKDMIGRQGIT